MARRVAFAGSFMSVIGLLVATVPGQAGGKKSDSEVKIAAAASQPDSSGRQTLTVTLIHNKGWHTYANPVGNEDFASNKTVITLLVHGKPVSAKIDYPIGRTIKDKAIGDYKVYQDKIAIHASLQRAQGDASPVQVQVRLQACSDKGICLLPATVKLTVK